VLRRRLKDLARDVERKLDDYEVGKLLMTTGNRRAEQQRASLAEYPLSLLLAE